MTSLGVNILVTPPLFTGLYLHTIGILSVVRSMRGECQPPSNDSHVREKVYNTPNSDGILHYNVLRACQLSESGTNIRNITGGRFLH